MVRGLRFSGIELEPRYHELGAQEYGCPGFTAETWKRIHYRTSIIKGLRAHSEHLHALMCPCCETALKPKPKLDRQKKFVVEQHIPFREPHHYRGNIPLWNFKYGGFPKWGSGVMYCGDSRHLLEVIVDADAMVSSSPYAHQAVEKNSKSIDRRKQYETYRSQGGGASFEGFCATQDLHSQGYGTSPGQLAAMLEGSAQTVVATSPPYNPPMSQDHSGKRGGKRGSTPSERGAFARYGDTEGQLEGLPMGEPNTVIAGSPPYVKKPFTPGIDMSKTPTRKPEWNNAVVQQRLDEQAQGYGTSPGQLAALPEGDAPSAIVSSSPYAESTITPQTNFKSRFNERPPAKLIGKENKGYNAIAASPPFAQSLANDGRGRDGLKVAGQLEKSTVQVHGQVVQAHRRRPDLRPAWCDARGRDCDLTPIRGNFSGGGWPEY